MRVTTDASLFGAWVADKLSQQKNIFRLLDIGTGTGLLSLMIAQKNQADIQALEIDPSAVQQARENIALAQMNTRITVIHSAMQDHHSAQPYDHIICNPPFFKGSLKSPEPQKNLSKHEINLPIETLAQYIFENLHPTGTASVLLPASRQDEASAVFTKAGLFVAEQVQVHQTGAHGAFRNMYWLQKTKTLPVHSRIILKDESEKYSEAFKKLLKDYYLNL